MSKDKNDTLKDESKKEEQKKQDDAINDKIAKEVKKVADKIQEEADKRIKKVEAQAKKDVENAKKDIPTSKKPSKEEKFKIRAQFDKSNVRDLGTSNLNIYIKAFVGEKLSDKDKKLRDVVGRELAYRNKTKRDIDKLLASQLTRKEMEIVLGRLDVKFKESDPNSLLAKKVRKYRDGSNKYDNVKDLII